MADFTSAWALLVDRPAGVVVRTASTALRCDDELKALVGRRVPDCLLEQMQTPSVRCISRTCPQGENCPLRRVHEQGEFLVAPIDVGEAMQGLIAAAPRREEGAESALSPTLGLWAGQVSTHLQLRKTKGDLRETQLVLQRSQQIGLTGNWKEDLDTQRLVCSEELLRMLQVDPTSAPTRFSDLLAVVHPEDRAIVETAREKALLDATQAVRIEHRLGPDNAAGPHVLCQTIQLETSASGQPKALIGVARDISERKAAETHLQQKQEMLARTESIAKIGSWEWDVDNDVVTWSDQTFRNFRRDPAKGTPNFNQEHDQLYPPEDLKRLRETVQRVLRDGGSYELELRMLCEDGEPRYALACGHAEVAPDGKVHRLYGFLQDITRRRASESAYHRFCNMASELICTADLETAMFKQVNPAFSQLLGYSREELLSRPFLDFVHPDDIDATLEIIEAELKKGTRVISFENRYRCKDGTYVWLDWNSHPIPEEGVTYAIAHDVTERKKQEQQRRQLEEQLQQSQKLEAIGRLAGGIAHDFNNKLQSILGYTDLLMETLGDGEQARKDLKQIRGAAEHSAQLTRQLLAFARKQTFSPRVLDLNQTVSGMLNMLRRLIGEDIGLVFEPDPAAGNVRIDPAQLDQILANLVVNARDAIEETGTITIASDRVEISPAEAQSTPEASPGSYAVLRIQDDGTGMEEEVRGKIFEPFYTTKEEGKGTGLGLAMVHGIVHQNEGFVTVTSQVGRGSTFHVHLPTYQSQPATREPTEDAHKPAHPRGAETILVVEDDLAILRFLTTTLERCGYRVLSFSSSQEALETARSGEDNIDLLVTDVVMPEINGKQLWQSLYDLQPHAACIFISGYTSDVIAPNGELQQATHFLAKPFSPAQLARQVRAVLDQRLPDPQVASN
jgi:PAS domain S-box-containing protein